MRLLSRRTVDYMTTNHLPGGVDLETFGQSGFAETTFDGVGFGLGFAVVIDPAAAKVPSSTGEYSWGGAASTGFWVDPAEDITAVFLTQLLPSSTYSLRPSSSNWSSRRWSTDGRRRGAAPAGVMHWRVAPTPPPRSSAAPGTGRGGYSMGTKQMTRPGTGPQAGRALVVAVSLVAAATGLWSIPVQAAGTPPRNQSIGVGGGGPGQFNVPRQLATDAAGNVYVADTVNHRIQVFRRNGSVVRAWGTQGSANGQFTSPNGVTVDGDNRVYVADTGNDRVQQFTTDGVFVRKWGGAGTANGQFDSPRAIVSTGTSVLVADADNNRIQTFSVNGAFIRTFGTAGTGNGQFASPRGLTVAANGDVIVADTGNNRIQELTGTGTFVRKWGSTGTANGRFNAPRGVAVDLTTGDVMVADSSNNRIQRFTSAGTFIDKVGGTAAGSGAAQFSGPVGVSVDGVGNVWVADTGNNRVLRYGFFDDPRPFVGRFGGAGAGTGPGVFTQATDLATDQDGNVYVVDPGKNRVQAFAPDGAFLRAFATSGSGNGQLNSPEGIATDPFGNVWVSDTGNHRVVVFSRSGSFLGAFGANGSGPGQFDEPVGIAVSSTNRIYVVDRAVRRVQEFTLQGAFVRQWGATGTGNGQFSDPEGVAVDLDGFVYVADTGNHRVQRFTDTGSFTAGFGTNGTTREQFLAPRRVAIDADFHLVVSDSGNHRIKEFTTSGDFVSQWGSTGSGLGQFSSPVGVSADPRGNVYTADSANNRIQRFAFPGTLAGVVTRPVTVGPPAPLAGGLVIAFESATFAIVRGAVTDGNGGYRMSVPPGRYILAFIDPAGNHRPEFFNDKLDPTTITQADFVPVARRQTATANALLTPVNNTPPLNPATLSGTITKPGGGAVAGGWAIAIAADGSVRAAVANASGQYSITGLAGGDVRVEFVDPSGANMAEFFDNKATFAGADLVRTTLGLTTTVNAVLADDPRF